jgi:alpha-L-fucosidase
VECFWPHIVKAGSFQGQSTTGQLDASDIRYTRNKAGTVVYAIVLGWPEQDVVLGSFRAGAERRPGTVARVEMLGSPEQIRFTQSEQEGVHIGRPRQRPGSDYAVTFRLSLA